MKRGVRVSVVIYLVTMLDRTGISAMTAVVMTALLLFSDEDVPDVVNTPPVTGFKPKIQTRCCKVWRKKCTIVRDVFIF